MAHPQDEDILLDIEQGEMQFDTSVQDEEFKAALKRRQLRILNSMDWQTLMTVYLQKGFEHIIPKGIDHILFVLGLFFSTLLIKRLFWLISLFTLAHTLTLALAVLGIVKISSSIVEPLIALSIVYIAYENVFKKSASGYQYGFVFLFGLLHGLGFATMFIEGGFSQKALIPSLVAFNIGVELGQLLVVLLAFCIFLYWRIYKKNHYRQWIQIPCSIIIGVIGSYWFFERVLGGII